DPLDRQAYAVAPVAQESAIPCDCDGTLAPGEARTVALAVAPGRSPAEALGAVLALSVSTGVLRASVEDPAGRPIPTASLELSLGGKSVLAYPGPAGDLEVRLPPGEYEIL